MRPATLVLIDPRRRIVPTAVDLTESEYERRTGLAGRATVERPMLFAENNERTLHYTMRTMAVPIDIAFIDTRGFFVEGRTARPGEDVHYSGRPVQWVIEMPAGWIDRYGILDSRVQAILVPNAPALARYL